MVMAGHQLPDDAFHSVSAAARRALGLQVAGLSPGDVADLVLVSAASVREAVAFGPEGRTVLRNGVIVAGT